jgi:acyl-CoA hydrolase
VAELRGRSVRERLKALTAIAHPDFRGWLREEAERLGIVPRVIVQGGIACP